jgi:hypothetical protein
MKKIIVIIGVLSLVFLTGCLSGTDINQIPLTEGEIPYALPAGTYTDSKGLLHIETNQRWSVSQAEYYKMILAYTREVKPVTSTNAPATK